jgi:hypothetical protein
MMSGVAPYDSLALSVYTATRSVILTAVCVRVVGERTARALVGVRRHLGGLMTDRRDRRRRTVSTYLHCAEIEGK